MRLALKPDAKIAGLVTVAGFVMVALAAQSAAVSRAATAGPAGTSVVSGTAARLVVTPPSQPVSVKMSSCDTEHWPFYSDACLRSDGATPTPRHVNLEQTASPMLDPPPVAVAAVGNVKQRSAEPHEAAKAPRRRKAHQTPGFASRTVRRVPQMQAESAGFGQALAFSW